jgi:hypothetical protein
MPGKEHENQHAHDACNICAKAHNAKRVSLGHAKFIVQTYNIKRHRSCWLAVGMYSRNTDTHTHIHFLDLLLPSCSAYCCHNLAAVGTAATRLLDLTTAASHFRHGESPKTLAHHNLVQIRYRPCTECCASQQRCRTLFACGKAAIHNQPS